MRLLLILSLLLTSQMLLLHLLTMPVARPFHGGAQVPCLLEGCPSRSCSHLASFHVSHDAFCTI